MNIYTHFIDVKHDDFRFEGLEVIVKHEQLSRYDASKYSIEVIIGEHNYLQGNVSDDFQELLETHVYESLCDEDGFYADLELGDLNLETKITHDLTTSQIERLCLSNLLIVDEKLDNLKSIIDMSGDTYWINTYRLCADFLDLTISELEYAAITCLYQLVTYKLCTSGGEDGKELNKQLLERKVKSLLNYGV